MNNKGNVAIMLLPVIAIALYVLSIMTFLNLNNDFEKISENVSQMSSELNVMQDYIEGSAIVIFEDFVKNGFTPDALVESSNQRDLHLQGQGNFFMKLANGEFNIGRNGDKVLIEVQNVSIQSVKGYNLWKREWDLKAEVGINGEFIRFINK